MRYGLKDIVTGESNSLILLFCFSKNRNVSSKNILQGKDTAYKHDEEGILLFDADNDGDIDMFIASGGYERLQSVYYQDGFYLNGMEKEISLQIVWHFLKLYK